MRAHPPFHAIDVGCTVCLFLVVGNDKFDVREFRHTEIIPVLAEEVNGEVLADVDVAAVLRTLGTSAGIVVERFCGGNDAVNKVFPCGAAAFIWRGRSDHDCLFSSEHFFKRERFAQSAGYDEKKECKK